MTVTNAFAESRNIPALRLAARVGMSKVIGVAHRFGITSDIPDYLPVALGTAVITLEEQVAAYAVFPNDGIRVAPRLIRRVSNADGITLWEDPTQVTEVIDQKIARTMMGMLEGVTLHGTGAAAASLKHPLGGKTGTTSDYTDAWFLGFSPSVTCGVWVGFDNNQTLGDKETGAVAALPIWINLMRVAIAGKDGEQFPADEPGAKMEEASATSAPRASPTVSRAVRTALKPATAPTAPKLNPSPQSPARVASSPPSQPLRTPTATSQVHPALSAPPPAVRPALSVKPALENTSASHQP
jgi:penicillin-binding protein 1A